MDKRIKTVWILSVFTMVLILCGQVYWLSTQYTYNREQRILNLEKDCSNAFKKELDIRLAKIADMKNCRRDSIITIFTMKRVFMKSHRTRNIYSASYSINGGKFITPDLKNVEDSWSSELTDRFKASTKIRISKETIDSILTSKGYDKTRHFRFYRTKQCSIAPSFKENAGRLMVFYSSNPLRYEAISFDMDIPIAPIIRNMTWQLILSCILIIVLFFCLWYQMRTIMIQKRIDGLRREFMKNMIYEMKQPPASENNVCTRIGNTDFYYSMNELRYGHERVIITSRQAEILRILSDHINEVVLREQILHEVWGDDSYTNSMSLNVQITYLRRALHSDETLYIEAIIKKGYILKCHLEEQA